MGEKDTISNFWGSRDPKRCYARFENTFGKVRPRATTLYSEFLGLARFAGVFLSPTELNPTRVCEIHAWSGQHFFGGAGAQMSCRHAMENLKTPPETRDAGLEGKNRRFQGFLGHTRKKLDEKFLSGGKNKIFTKNKKFENET